MDEPSRPPASKSRRPPEPAGAERPLAVISNRLPLTARETDDGVELVRSSGGLVAALDGVLRRRTGTWVGWPGSSDIDPEAYARLDFDYRIEPVEIDDEDYGQYYEGLANGALWPLLHSLVDRASFSHEDWQAYERVNRRFAEVVAAKLPEGGLAWFHDYHLLRAPLHLRRLRPDAHLAFFLHVPFPPPDIWRILPWDRSAMRGMLACDLVGFHVDSYARNFLDCAQRLLGARVDRGQQVVELGTHVARVGAFPLGIDFQHFENLAQRASLDRSVADRRIVLGVDRLDYTKGIPERVLAFERLLEDHEELRGNVALVQLAVPSRSNVTEYEALKRHLDELVGRVNGRFGTETWTPVQYLYRSVPPERLAALYRDADVALVTPLRDGMNLVAKEYVASQVSEPGVLVLSRLAGAAETMREALLVNPYDVEGLSRTLHEALTMERAERYERLDALRWRERINDVDYWTNSFLEAASAPPPELHPLSESDFETWFGSFVGDHHVFLLLDYDGTLSPIADHPDQAELPRETRDALKACLARPDVDVAIISGRALADVRRHVAIEGITYTGNHGLEMDGPELGRFHHEDLRHFEGKISELARDLADLAREGAWVEEKGPTLTFHVRQVPAGLREQLLRDARRRIADAGLQAREAHSAVEARPPIPWDKGHAALHLVRAIHGRDWAERVRVLYAGDDETDEDAFRRLHGLALTVRVGPFESSTAADHRLRDPAALRGLLRWIARRGAQAATGEASA